MHGQKKNTYFQSDEEEGAGYELNDQRRKFDDTGNSDGEDGERVVSWQSFGGSECKEPYVPENQ